MAREEPSISAHQAGTPMNPNPELEEYMRDLKARAKEFGQFRVAEKEFRIAQLEAEIADLQHEIQLLQRDMGDEQE